MTAAGSIQFADVSKFYGEVLGVNRIDLAIPPGITSLVGPNGSGKTTLMNLMTGLIQPTQGTVKVLGESLAHPERVFRLVGYCTQYDTFPRGVTGFEFLYQTLRLHGFPHGSARRMTGEALERVSLVEAGKRKVAGYSKGMRQRIKLAQAICHQPPALVLDEPLNGLDPLARSEVIALFRDWAREGRHLIISSHILHEVDMISDQVVFLHSGYVVGEGGVKEVRSEIGDRPRRVQVRCDRAALLASRMFEEDHVVEVRMHADRGGLQVATRDADRFYAGLNRLIVECDLEVERVMPADDDVQAVYQYLLGSEGGAEA